MSEQDQSVAFATSDFDEDFVRGALDMANMNVLRIALYHATGDERLIKMRLEKVPANGGMLLVDTVAPEHHDELKEIAIDYLRGRPDLPPPPSPQEARRLMELFTVGNLDEAEYPFGHEELAFEDFSREVRWSKKPSDETLAKFHVVVIGGGISGLAAAIQLTRLGIPYTVIERREDIGGTWLINNYPEARVDIGSFIYQYKFEKNYPWKEYFSTRDETQKYLNHIATKYGVLPNFQFDTEVVSATWQEDSATWAVGVRHKDGTTRTINANVVLSGAGLFNAPKLPDIEGIELYDKPMFHTTDWDHGTNLTGKNVALIGTGSTGSQLMPRVAQQANHLTVFQRTPSWIIPAENYREDVPAEIKWLLDHVPYYWNWSNFGYHSAMAASQELYTFDSDWQATGGQISERNDSFRAFLLNYMAEQIGDRPDLMAKCTPGYAPFSRRPVVDNGWFQALRRDNVDLVTDPIDHFTKDGIVTRDGQARDFDAVILSSGFQVSRYFWPVHYVGRNGQTLEQLWAKDGARAYLGITIPGFPNFFCYYGPNGQPRAGAYHSWAEIWTRYILGNVVRMIEGGHRAMDVKQEVFDEYNDRMDAIMPNLLWVTEGAGSYYINEHGRQGVNSPWEINKMHGWLTDPNPDDFKYD